jgi:antirestriction protein ArdC
MKAEQARKMTDEGLARLAEALEQGKSEELTRFLAMVARFHRYSFGNVMLILTQRPDATHVAGFQTWKTLDRYVKKGEKGIVIIAPMMLKARDAERADDESKRVLRFKAVHVFDVSQTDGEPLPEVRTFHGDPGLYTDRVRTLIASRGIELRYEDSLGSADGLSAGGRIAIKNGLSKAEEFSVLVHELAHEMLHHGEGSVRGTKSQRETEAEAVAFVVSQAVGLDAGTSSSDYIQLYDGDSDTLAGSLDRIQKAACEILTSILDEPEEQELLAA